MLASLENGTIFKKAFTDKEVFTRFVKDITGVDIKVNKIETEKEFEPRPGNVAIKYDIFAESIDHRVIIEIQRVDYDYNFDRFLHYHIMAIAQLQRKAKDYVINKKIYTIIFLTVPYKINESTKLPIEDDVLITSLDPRNLQDKVVKIYGHQLIFLNPHYKSDDTPKNYLDWLELVYESSHNPEDFKVNLKNKGIKKAVEIINYDQLHPDTIAKMKIEQQRKAMLKIVENEGIEKGVEIGMEKGIEKGVEIGMEKGVEKGKKEMAIKMLRSGINIDEVSRITGFTAKELEES